MGIDVYKLSVPRDYQVASKKVLRSCFMKCQSSFVYVVKHGIMGLRIFSIRDLKVAVDYLDLQQWVCLYTILVWRRDGVIIIL